MLTADSGVSSPARICGTRFCHIHELPADSDCVTGRDYAAAYLEPLAMTGRLIECLRLEAQVVAVGRSGLLKGDMAKRAERPFRLLVRDAKGAEHADEADVVLDCTGTSGQPRWLGDGGIPAAGESAARPHIAYGLEDVLGDTAALVDGDRQAEGAGVEGGLQADGAGAEDGDAGGVGLGHESPP